jgi:hypothetical protein
VSNQNFKNLRKAEDGKSGRLEHPESGFLITITHEGGAEEDREESRKMVLTCAFAERMK